MESKEHYECINPLFTKHIDSIVRQLQDYRKLMYYLLDSNILNHYEITDYKDKIETVNELIEKFCDHYWINDKIEVNGAITSLIYCMNCEKIKSHHP